MVLYFQFDISNLYSQYLSKVKLSLKIHNAFVEIFFSNTKVSFVSKLRVFSS